METVVGVLGATAIALAVILFFGPIVVIISIIGRIDHPRFGFDYRERKYLLPRFLMAVVGGGAWLYIYLSIFSLARSALNISMSPTLGPSTAIPLTPNVTELVNRVTDEPPTPTLLPTDSHTEVPTLIITPIPSVEMVLVPVGIEIFWMGSSFFPEANYFPTHVVYLGEFYIDKYEVTNAQYTVCVQDGVCMPPSSFTSNTREDYYDQLSQYGNFPVIFITWANAKAFCEWRGDRLPTEAEWEKAAKYNPETGERTLYPWGGTAPNPEWVNFDSQDTTEVGIFSAGQSAVGAFDMAGNVLEWVHDFYDPAYYFNSPEREPQGPTFIDGEHVARGGAWSATMKQDLWTFARYYFPESTTRNDLGFRCASSEAS